MNTFGVDLMGRRRRRRRRHSADFKAAVVSEGMRPGVSIAEVALAHRLNANMLRKWVIDAKQVGTKMPRAPAAMHEAPALPSPSFVPFALTAPPVEGDIRIELHRAGSTVNVTWPAVAARDFAA